MFMFDLKYLVTHMDMFECAFLNFRSHIFNILIIVIIYITALSDSKILKMTGEKYNDV